MQTAFPCSCIHHAYHGHSLGSLALTGNQYYHDISYSSHNIVTHLPFDGYLGDFDTSLILRTHVSDASMVYQRRCRNTGDGTG